MYVDARRNYMVFDVETQQSRLLIRVSNYALSVNLKRNPRFYCDIITFFLRNESHNSFPHSIY